MKDPAVLFYIDNWLSSTAEMDADVRGWYLNLILHNYDKKTLPNDIEKLAVLAGVKFSEFERFKQVFEQVLKHKFEQVDENRLSNPNADEILMNRDLFKDKRSNAGKMSYFLKLCYKKTRDKKIISFLKDNVDLSEFDLKNKQMFEQVFEHLSELYINGNGDVNSYKNQEWYKDFEVYKKELRDSYSKIIQDKKYISERENYHPGLDIKKTIEKACKDYWSTEAGWKNKKNARTVNIDWVATFNYALSQKVNQVWKEKSEERI